MELKDLNEGFKNEIIEILTNNNSKLHTIQYIKNKYHISLIDSSKILEELIEESGFKFK